MSARTARSGVRPAAPRTTSKPPYLRAELHLRNGNVDEAITSFERTVERMPRSRESMLKLAHLYFDRDRVEEALAMAERVVALGDRADDDAHLCAVERSVESGGVEKRWPLTAATPR